MTALCLAALCGCTTKRRSSGSFGEGMDSFATGTLAGERFESGGSPAAGEMTDVQAGRMLVWTADLRLQVASVSNAVRAATSLVKRGGGFVAQHVEDGDEAATLVLRIPSKAFDSAMAGLEALGTPLSKNIAATDVTEQYVDVEARLKNRIALRDRLKQLLEKAVDVKDILAIETEFGRVQADIDSMEGRIKSLAGQLEYAMTVLKLEKAPPPEQQRILGPLGYLLHGLHWCVEKLFVIRE
jgi:hypothetical protein